jgi:uncharacterized iron-regulated membrane protein
MLRRTLFWLHLCAGITAGLLILLMSVTGVLLTYEHQLVDAAAHRNHLEAVPGSPQMSADQLAAIARRETAPGARLSLVFDADPTAPVAVTAGRETALLLNAYTGEKLTDASAGSRQFFRIVENWHRWMGGEPRGTRASLIDIANLLFLFIVISGIYLWLPAVWRWRTLRGLMLFQPRYINAKVRDFNWHHVFSFWMLIPLFLIALSGVVMSYGWANQLVYAAFGEQPPGRNGPPGDAGTRGAPLRTTEAPQASMQQLLDVTTSQIDNWQRISIPVEITGDRIELSVEIQSDARRAPRRPITLSTSDASVLRLAPPPAPLAPTQSPGQTARTWFRFVHTGEQYGIIGQTFAGLASLAACFLVYTGLALAWRRLLRPLYRRTP